MDEPARAPDNAAWTRGTRWASFALLALADAVASLIVPPTAAPLTYMFSPLLLVPAAFLFWLDLHTQSKDHGAKALTAIYWTGQPMPRWQRILFVVVAVYLLGYCLAVLFWPPASAHEARPMPPQIAWMLLIWSACYPLWYVVVKPRLAVTSAAAAPP